MDPRISLAYTARTLHQLEQLRVDYKWTDIILFADGSEREFPAHRCVLASASPYFRAMLVNGAFVEANKGSVTLKGVTDNGIQILLEFIYSGEVKLSVERISEALKVGTLTQVGELITTCEDFLSTSLDIDNVVDIWTHSTDFCLARLQKHVLDYVGTHLTRIDRKVLLRFDGDFMARLLRDAVISCLESKVLSIVVQWIQFNFKYREKYAKGLLSHIFWDRIHLRDTRLAAVKCPKPLRQQILESSRLPSPTVPRGMEQGILILGGFSIDGPMNEMRFMPMQKSSQAHREWRICARLPTQKRTVDFGACALPDGGVLLCGGSFLDDSMVESRSSLAFIYDVHTSRWIFASPMKRARSGCGTVWFRNFIYVFGGDVDRPTTYERFNLCNNSWEFLGECPIPSDGFAICVAKDKILVSGGMEDAECPGNNFWSYDPENVVWSLLPGLPTPCSDHAMFYHERKVFCLGGWSAKFGQHTLVSDVSSFTPETGWITEDWTSPSTRAFQQYVYTGKSVVVVGGGSLKASERLSREVMKENAENGILRWFDLRSKKWSEGHQSGVPCSFWDHKTVMAFLPLLQTSLY